MSGRPSTRPQWWAASARAVKAAIQNRHNTRPHARKNHLEGWPLGVISVGLALIAALLAAPRAIDSRALPLPRVDRLEERLHAHRDHERAARAEHDTLPYDVRAVGEALRRFGKSDAGAAQADFVGLQHEIRERASRALKRHGTEPLLTLRAVQTQLFLRALDEWEDSGVEPADLTELGGAFAVTARARAWTHGASRLVLDTSERRALFRMRWLELTGLRKVREFAPSLNEWRAYHRAWLRHAAPAATTARARVLEQQLDAIRALDKLDPDYPTELANGIVAYHMGDAGRAARELRLHLAGPRGNVWRLRARNHLAAALRGNGGRALEP